MRRVLLLAGALAGALATMQSGGGLAGAQPPVPLSQARLQGAYAVTGVVTRAVGVPGEHRGQPLARTWTFQPTCPAGPCPAVALIRPRAAGVDQLTLQARGPGHYVGRASFLVPVRCRRRLWRRGELVPFRITVRVTAAIVQGPVILASRFVASYYNPRRIGLTPCFTPPGHDSARYVGVLPGAGTAPAGSIRRVETTPPSRAS